MNKRQVDKTKKANIKCEHCKYGKTDAERNYFCTLKKEKKNYWNRCKDFEWKEEV